MQSLTLFVIFFWWDYVMTVVKDVFFWLKILGFFTFFIQMRSDMEGVAVSPVIRPEPGLGRGREESRKRRSEDNFTRAEDKYCRMEDDYISAEADYRRADIYGRDDSPPRIRSRFMENTRNREMLRLKSAKIIKLDPLSREINHDKLHIIGWQFCGFFHSLQGSWKYYINNL